MAFIFDEGTKNIAATATEYTLNAAAITTACAVQLLLDVSDMADGDSLLVRIYEEVVSGGTQRITSFSINNAQGADGDLWAFPSLIVGNNCDITVTQTAGVALGNTLGYSIRMVS